jgi:hypothetical protein
VPPISGFQSITKYTRPCMQSNSWRTTRAKKGRSPDSIRAIESRIDLFTRTHRHCVPTACDYWTVTRYNTSLCSKHDSRTTQAKNSPLPHCRLTHRLLHKEHIAIVFLRPLTFEWWQDIRYKRRKMSNRVSFHFFRSQ